MSELTEQLNQFIAKQINMAAALHHEGLVPKKVTVVRGGKPHIETRYTKPDGDNQPLAIFERLTQLPNGTWEVVVRENGEERPVDKPDQESALTYIRKRFGEGAYRLALRSTSKQGGNI